MSDVRNHLENLEIQLEQDSNYDDYVTPPEVVNHLRGIKLLINGGLDIHTTNFYTHINVIPEYQGNLSEGQKGLYDFLLGIQVQETPIFIDFHRISRELGVIQFQAIEKRLENLQLVGAISGYRINIKDNKPLDTNSTVGVPE